ncbi:MAG TPA: hypothetical protein VFF91_12335 [Pseudoxanthomonas sp.]|nr:hypothetical protein [Pseudoxanthomonas sp.]
MKQPCTALLLAVALAACQGADTAAPPAAAAPASVPAFASASAPPPAAVADDACLLTPDELKAATGQDYRPGQPGLELGTGAPLCHYLRVAQPGRLTVGLHRGTGARAQFQRRQGLLGKTAGRDIALPGVGEAAYAGGTAAGVLVGDAYVALSGTRRPSEPELDPEAVRGLLRAAVARL